MATSGNRPPEPPLLPPVIFDDDTPGPGGPLDGDSGLLRVVGVIILLGIVIAVLVLPPVSILGRGGDSNPSGIEIKARDELPALPDGLLALSALYDITVPDEFAGAATLTVKLAEPAAGAQNVAFYTFGDGGWLRLASADLLDDGGAAVGVVDVVPATIAVLQRTTLARALGLIVDAQQTPDPLAAGGAIVSVTAAVPALDPDDDSASSVSLQAGALEAALAGGQTVYLGLRAGSGAETDAIDRILATPALIEAHVEAVVAAANAEGAAGVHVDYIAIDAARRDPFTAFVTALSQQLRANGLGLVVSVPTPAAADSGAYDWEALGQAADALWLRAPDDAQVYYEQLETALEVRRTEGFDLSAVWLVVDRRSRERTAEGIATTSLRDALTVASALQTVLDGGIAPGEAVSVSGVNIEQGTNNTGLHWSDRARVVTFSYVARGGPRSVWIENRFSVAFRLDLAGRFGLGGVVVDAAAEDETLPNVWNTVSTFVEEGTVRLELPYGPYLSPRWRSSDGTVEGGEDGVIVWRAPERAGAYDITLVVSDGVIFVGQQISLLVTEEEEPAPQSAQPVTEPAQQSVQQPASEPAAEPTQAPTPEPTQEPTAEPTQAPTPEPTPTPTSTPTSTPPAGPPGPAGN